MIEYFYISEVSMTELCLRDALMRLPKRRVESNKGDYGMLLSIVGSAYYRGAAQLSSLGALRTGVGILRVASTERVISSLAASLPEAVYLPLDEGDCGEITAFDTRSCFDKFPRTTAVLCGCGLTTYGDIPGIVEDVILNSPCPVVLDADGLNALAGRTELLKKAKSDLILTPHIGELARLTGNSIECIRSDAEAFSSEFAREHKLTLVLKSHDTIIATPNEIYISRFGNPGLARGGSGDILAGMIASLAAQGMDMLDAAICGTVLHGSAADRAARRLSMTGMLPHDILTDLCQIFCEEGR